MRRIGFAVIAVMVLLSSCGATLRIHGTVPSSGNDGTCTAPVLFPLSSAVTIHAQVIGRALEDSIVSLTPGSAFAFSWTVPPGAYQVRVWGSLSALPVFAGCDTTATFAAAAPPWRPALQ